MEYLDPHHKRTEFSAKSFTSGNDEANRCVSFAGHGQYESVVLREQGLTVIAKIPEADCDFTLWKAQVLEKSKWLTLDFEDNPRLHRIMVHIEGLDVNELDSALKSLIGTRTVHYFRH